MGGQGFERRQILRFIGIASVAATFPGFHRWAFACTGSPAHEPVVPSPTSYTPLFFSPDHFKLVDQLAEMIIPADDTQGARAAGVAEFIDFMVANRVPVSPRCEIRSTEDALRQGEDAQERFIEGLNWINAHSKAEFGSHFLNCTPDQQNALLEELAIKDKFKPTTESGREFFQFVRDYTVIGYYTSKVGLESLGYPGLRVVWPKLPGCSHHDDPQHTALTLPEGHSPLSPIRS